jgi:hypothetical protein
MLLPWVITEEVDKKLREVEIEKRYEIGFL